MHSEQKEPIKILVVDDEADMREGLKDVLEDSGYRVRLACNGHEALSHLAEDFFHVVTLDMKMPGLSGIEVLQTIREINQNIAVIIMTGYGSLEVAVDAMRQGAHDYLIKPIDMEEMKVTIEKAIEKQRLAFENERLVRNLEKINEQLKMKVDGLLNLNEASRLLCSVLDIDALLESCLDTVTSMMRSERVSIMLVEQPSGELVIKKSRGIREEIVNSVRVKPGEGVSGRVAREGKPLRNVDLEFDNRKESNLSRNYTSKAFLSIPVYRKDKVIGVLNVTNRRIDEPFSDDERDLISILANQAAIAIENAELYTNLEKTLNQVKATQEQLIRSEKLASLGQLAAGIAHEINNPLAIISGCAQLLSILAAKKEKLTELDFREISRDLDTIIRETEHCGRLTENLLQFSKRSPQEVKPTDINELLKQTVSLIENQSNLKRIKVTKKLGHGLPSIIVDHGQIRQVFLNMILNAAQAMIDGGTLGITTRQTPSSIEIIFQDTGMGIPEENLKGIFDPFFTTKKEGVGLGLFISQTIIERHKGSINVSSRVGEGTTFTISLPVNT